jgi:hypothetical protein
VKKLSDLVDEIGPVVVKVSVWLAMIYFVLMVAAMFFWAFFEAFG